MSRKVGQIIARGERRWLVRVYLGRDSEMRKRTYHNQTVYGSLRNAQAYLTRRLHERDLSRGVEGLQRVQTGIAVGNDLGDSHRRREAATDSKARDARLQCRGDQNFSESCAADDVRDFV